MNKSVLTIVFLLLSADAFAQGDKTCKAPVFPAFSPSTESARDVEKQLLRWRACHGMNARGREPSEAARLDAEVDDKLQKWADATRVFLDTKRSAYQPYERAERKQQTELLTRPMPARATYSSERR